MVLIQGFQGGGRLSLRVYSSFRLRASIWLIKIWQGITKRLITQKMRPAITNAIEKKIDAEPKGELTKAKIPDGRAIYPLIIHREKSPVKIMISSKKNCKSRLRNLTVLRRGRGDVSDLPFFSILTVSSKACITAIGTFGCCCYHVESG